MALSAFTSVAFLLLACQDPPSPLAAPGPEIVLTDDADPLPLRAFGLGDGGVAEVAARGGLGFTGDGCTTPGGVVVQCLAVGVKLAFPSGAELLLAPDGHLHERSGGVGGPFAGGVELRLGDGAAVRIVLAPGQRQRLRDVFVVAGERVLQPWRRGEPARELARRTAWGGPRLCCCGHGVDVFRAVALGPMVVLDRVLVAPARALAVPAQRLVLATAPLLQSMQQMSRQHRVPDAGLRRSVAAIAATAQRGSAIFPAGASLQRAERDRLRWLLRAGHELQLDLDGPQAPRLMLFAGRSPQPMVEWTLAGNPAAFLPHPDEGQPGAGRWHGNGTRLPRFADDLQAREELFERGYALRVVQRLLPR
jgi:hypothetical protein